MTYFIGRTNFKRRKYWQVNGGYYQTHQKYRDNDQPVLWSIVVNLSWRSQNGNAWYIAKRFENSSYNILNVSQCTLRLSSLTQETVLIFLIRVSIHSSMTTRNHFSVFCCYCFRWGTVLPAQVASVFCKKQPLF